MRPQPVWPLALLAALAAAGLWFVWRVDPAESGLPMCGFYRLTGLCCPGCGATRATHALFHGHLLAALHDNALWVLVLPLAAYAGASQGMIVFRGRPLPGDLLRRPWFLLLLGGAVVLFGVVRNIPAWPFTLLVPV